MSMKIHFYRQGFANNSSSQHNIIFTRSAPSLVTDEDNEFGWDHFTCASKDGKLNYMLICLYRSYRMLSGVQEYSSIIDQKVVTAFIEANFKMWVSANFPILKDKVGDFSSDYDWGYVDHQSEFTFPCHRKKEKFINIDFANSFIRELVMEDYVILGGNDNTEERHPKESLDEEDQNLIGTVYRFFRERHPQEIFCEKDEKLGDYVISNLSRGDLMRISFEQRLVNDAIRILEER